MNTLRLPALIAALVLFLAAAAIAQPERVSFLTGDKITIVGELHATGRTGAPAVIALHEYGKDHRVWQTLAPVFAAAGIDFLAIDMRGHGASTRKGAEDLSGFVQRRDGKFFQRMFRDVQAAVKFLDDRGNDRRRIALLGAGVGCGVAIDAAKRDKLIRGVCLLSPGINDLSLVTLLHMKVYGRSRRPVLMFSTREDAGEGALQLARSEHELELCERTGIRGTELLAKVPGTGKKVLRFLMRILAAPVALDGVHSKEERAGTRLFVSEDEGFHLRLTVFGDYCHLVLSCPEEVTPDGALLALAPGERTDRITALEFEFTPEGTEVHLRRLMGDEWV